MARDSSKGPPKFIPNICCSRRLALIPFDISSDY
jgi:hypothetical protein